MAGLGTGAPIVKVYHEKSMILPDVSRVLACLYEKDIEFERYTASYKSLLRLQASSHAPVPFYDGLTFLEESREICRYIAETYEHRGDPFLLGKDSLERASIEQWLHHEEHAFNPPSRSLFCHLAFPFPEEEEDDIDLQKIKLEEVLEVYEQRLGDSKFLAGNKFTLADLVHLPNSHYITKSDKFAYLYDSRKNVQRWWNDISTRKSWQNVLKDIQVVEQQHKQEEFEKQQRQQWPREHRPTTRRQIHLDSRKQASTNSQTILVPPPVGIISTSPTASQAEKPLPTETSPDETLLSPTAHKSSAVQSKHTTFFTTHRETPPAPIQSTPRLPGYSHIPVQSTGFYTDNSATNADTQDKESVRHTDRTPQRRAETSYGGPTDQRVTYTSPGKHGSTEAHQKLQAEKWHAAAAGLSNLKGETDYLVSTHQVKPGKDVQHSSSQDSGQESTHPLAQEPVSMDKQQVQGPEMTTRESYTDQKRDVSSMPWRQAADVRGIAEEDKASSYHRDAVLPPYTRKHAEETKIASADHIKDASPPKHVKDEDTQAIPFQRAYDDAHDITREARETASAPRRRRAQDAYDTSEVIETYHSSSSRAHPINAPQDAASPPKQAASEGPRRYRGAQEFTKQARGSPASRPTVPGDAQGNTEEETVESLSSKAHLLDSRLANDRPQKKFLDEDGYGASVPLQTRSADDPYERKRDRHTAAPKRMMSQDASEETKMSDSASFEAQTLDHRQADAPPPKQRLDEDPQTTASPLKKPYSGGEDTTEQSKPSASRPRRMAAQEIQDNFEETKAGGSRSTRKRPSDSWQAPAPLPRHEADDVRTAAAPSQKRDPGTGSTIKEVEDITSMPRRMAGEDANETLEETKFAESASSQAQPLYYHRTDTPSRKREPIEDRRGATSPLERRYADAEDTTKHSRDTVFKPRKIVGQDAEDTSEEAEARNSALFRAQPQDARRVATTPSKQAAEDALSVSQSSPKRHPRAEETSKQPRAAASKPTHIAAQDARDVFIESEAADSTSSTEQPSDAQAAASFQKQEVPDAHNASASSQKRYPDVKGATKKLKVTFEETKNPDSASSRVQPLSSQRDYAPSLKKEAPEAPRTTTPFKKRDSDVEDTAKHSDGAFKPRQMVGQDTQGIYEETKASDTGLLREQSSDTLQAATTPTEKVATEDGPGGTPPSERNAPNDEDTTTRPGGTASAPRRTTARDASGAFQESKPADSVSSREQPLSARQPVVTPRQETEDSISKISAFHKTRPFVEDSTRPAVDTVFGQRQIGAEDTKDISEETKVADSASSVRARPTYTPRTARPLSEKAQVKEDEDKDREDRETISAPKKMVSRDGEHTYGERKIPHSASREQSLDNLQASSPLKQAAAEDPRGASRGAKESLVDETKESQGVKGASKKSAGTFEETKDPASTLPTAQTLSAQDDQHTHRSSRTPTADQPKDASTHIWSNLQDSYQEERSSSANQKGSGSSPSQVEAGDDDQAIIGENVLSSEQLKKMLKGSRSRSSKAQPADSRSHTKVERTPSVYQEDHLAALDSPEQPQILTTGVGADGSTPKRQQAPVVPSTSEEKSTPPTPPRAKVHDDHTTDEPFKRETVDDPKGAALSLGQEPTSRVHRATELTPDRDMSSKLSTIDQWRRASAPMQGITANSRDDVQGVSSIDQKPTPMSQQTTPSARGANEVVKREQRMVPSAPAGAQTPDVQHAPPSFAGADMAERDGDPVQMQEQTLHARPTSVPTRRATPDGRDTGDNEFANPSDAQRWKALKAKHNLAMINEDVRDASLSTHDPTGDKKTTRHASEAQGSDTLPSSTATPVNVRPTSGDELVERFSRDQGARPPESTQAQTPFNAPRDSVSTQGLPSDALDKTKFAKPSSTEGMAPTAGRASALEAQLAEHKFAPSDKKPARAARPLSSGESRKEDTNVSAAGTKKPQTIFHQQVRPTKPVTKQVPPSNADHDKRKIQQVTLGNLPTDDSPASHVPSYEQVSRAPQKIPSERYMTPAPTTSDTSASNTQIASAKFQEAIPDYDRPDELTVPSHDAHGSADDNDIINYPSKQAQILEYRPDSTPAHSYVHPTSGDEPGISPDQGAESPTAAQATNSKNQRNEVFPTGKNFSPSDQDSVHSGQQPFPAETRRGKTIVAAAEQTPPTNIGQQHTQDTREAPTSDFVPAEDMPSDARSGRPDEVPLVEQKFASSDQNTQLASSVEPRNEEIRNTFRSAQPVFSAADDQTKDPQKNKDQRDIEPTPGPSKQLQEVAPDDQYTVESLPSQGQVSRAKPSFVLSEGPTRDSVDIDKKTTKLPSSQAPSSVPKPDSTQNRSDEPATRFFPSQLAEQRVETQAQPPLVGPYDSKSSQDVTSDTLGKAKSLKPSSIDQETTGSALTPDTHLGSAPGEAPAGQKLLFKDQDSAHPIQKSSSSEPTKEQTAVAAPNEAKTSPTIFSQQDIALAQTKMKDPSPGSQYVPQRLQEITPEDQRITGSIPRQQQVPHFEHISKPRDGPTPDPHGAFVEEPMAHTTGPTTHAQYGMAPSGLSPDEEKPEISDKDLDHHTQPRSSAGSRKEEGHLDPSDQTIMPTPGTSESSGEVLEVGPGNYRSSELTTPLIPSHKQDSHAGDPEGPNPDAHRAVADENKPPPRVSRAHSLEVELNSAPSSDDVIPTSGYEPVAGLTNERQKQTQAAFQASLPPEALYDSIDGKRVSADAFGEVGALKATGEVAPSDQSIAPSEPLRVVESRKESTGAEAEESKVYQPVSGQKDIRHAPGISEHVLDDDHNKELVSREEQVSHDQRASELREGSPPDVHGASLDKTIPPSSQVGSSDPKRDSLPKSVDVNPTSGQQSTTRLLRGQGAQLPALTRSLPLHESLLYPESNEDVPQSSANQEAMSSKVVPASAPDTILGTASDEIAPDGQNFPLPARDLARSAQRPFSVEPTKEKGIVASSDQTSEARTIIGQQGVTPSTYDVKASFDLQGSELAKPPNEDQEQAHAGSAYEQREGPTPDTHGAVVEKMPLPSSQAENSDIAPDSVPISGDAHHTNVGGPTTSSLRDSEAQPPTGTQNVPALFVEKTESPTPPSTDQELMTPMTSPAPALQDEDSTQPPQLSPSVVSRKDVANANQTDVPQAGLRVPGSSDATLPSEKIQEFSPDASLTNSVKPLLPMTGTNPVQPPHEASFDLSSDGKPTMIKGDQANTVSNVSLSASQPVGQSENSAVEKPLSEKSISSFSPKNLERTLPEEKSKQQQQTDQSSTRSSNDDGIESSGIASPNILTTGDLQPSPLKESMHATERSRNQEQADQAVFQSTQDKEKKIHENEAQDNGSDRPEEIRPDSAPISGDARRTSGDAPATFSSRDSQEQPPAGTLNVPAVFLEKMKSPRPPSTDQELMTSKTSPVPAPDALQDQDSTPPKLSPSVVSRKDVASADQTNVSQAGLREPATSDVTRPSEKTQEFSPDAYLTKSEKPLLPMEGTDPVQSTHGASFHLSSNEKPTMIKGEQTSTISNVSLSTSQPVGQSENSAVKGPLSEDFVSSASQKNLERTLPEEKSKQKQTDQSSTISSKDDSTEASGITSPNILTTSGNIQPSPPKESMQAAQGSRNQQQAGQAVFQSIRDSKKQIEETEAQENGSYEPKKIRPDSAPISSDARRTSDDGPATSSLRGAQPPAGTRVAAGFLENIESPRPPSTDQEPVTPMTSPAPAPDAPQDEDSTQSPQLAPSVVSRKDFADADQTNVPQAGLRESASSDATRPSDDFSPDAYLTKSDKPLLPMTDDSLPKSVDVNPSSGQQSTTRLLRGQGAQLPLTRSPPLHESLLYPESKEDVPESFANQEVTSPKVVPESAPDTILGTASDEIAPDGQTFPMPARDLARSARQPFSVEPTKEKGIVASSDQTSEARTIIGQRGVTPSADKVKTPFDLQASELAKPPNENQEQAHAGSAYEQREGPTPDAHGAVDEKTSLPSSRQAENPDIAPDSAPISGDAHHKSGDGPAVSSLHDSQARPPVFLEKMESPRPVSTDQESMTLMTSQAPAPDAPQDQASTQSPQLSPSAVSRKDVGNANQNNVAQAGLRGPASSDAIRPSEQIQEFSPDAYLTKSAEPLLPMTGTDPVQAPHEASFDLLSSGKPNIIKGDQANKISNVSLSASKAVGQSENSAVEGPLSKDSVSPFSHKSLEGTLPEEKLNQQQQTDQSNTRSSKDDSIVEAGGTAEPDISTSGDTEPLPLKESMQGADGSRNQQQVDQAVFDDEKQFKETEARVIGPGELYERNLQRNRSQKKNRASQRDALEQPEELVPAVQPQSNNMNIGSKTIEDAPGSIQEDSKLESSLRTSEETEQQVEKEGKIQGGTKAPASEGEQPEERDFPSRNKGIAGQSQAETSSKPQEQTSYGTQSSDRNSSKLDGSTDDAKPGADAAGR